jgi:hypothetical protein
LYPGGLSPAVVRQVEADGHELALHYDAKSGGEQCRWGREHLLEQTAWLKRVANRGRIVSNKNHYLRWEGWDDFYLWCEEAGLEVDQSHGPTKQGNVGYPFGSCHLSFPLTASPDGRRSRVLSLPLQTQDLALTTPVGSLEVFLGQALEHHGIAHLLFHGVHIHTRPEVRAALRRAICRGQELGLQFWTSEQLNGWERARRGVDIEAARTEQGWRIEVSSQHPLRGAAVLLPASHLDPDTQLDVLPSHAGASVVQRHGVRHVELVTDLPAGHSNYTVTVT